MALLIIVIIFFIVGIVLYKKGVLGKKVSSPTLPCDSICNSDPSSFYCNNQQYALKLFDLRRAAKEDGKTDLYKLGDDITDYVEDMVSLYNRRGEHYDLSFVNMDSSLLVVFKHWD